MKSGLLKWVFLVVALLPGCSPPPYKSPDQTNDVIYYVPYEDLVRGSNPPVRCIPICFPPESTNTQVGEQ